MAALSKLKAQGYRKPACLPSALDLLPAPIIEISKRTPIEKVINLPDILVPPDDDDEFGLSMYPGCGPVAQQSGGGKRRGKKRANNNEEEKYRAGAGIERIPCFGRWFKGVGTEVSRHFFAPGLTIPVIRLFPTPTRQQMWC